MDSLDFEITEEDLEEAFILGAEAQTIEPPTDEEIDALRAIGPTAIIGNRENAVKLLRYTLDHMEEIIANLEN